MRSYPTLIFWTIAGLVCLAIGSIHVFESASRLWTMEPFHQQVEQFLTMDIVDKPGQPPVGLDKILPINVGERAVDDVLFDLPLAMRPSHPNNVKTVAFLNWSNRAVSQYVDKEGKATSVLAIQNQCRIRVVDVASRQLLAEKVIDGDLPPDRIRSRESSEGPRPVFAVVQYLQSLTQSEP